LERLEQGVKIPTVLQAHIITICPSSTPHLHLYL